MSTTSLAQQIGARIRSARLAAGLTQSQLAEPELTRGYVSQLENGLIRPSVRSLHVLASKLQKPVPWFLDDLPMADVPPMEAAPVRHQPNPRSPQSEQEWQLLKAFRQLPPGDRRLIMAMVRRLRG